MIEQEHLPFLPVHTSSRRGTPGPLGPSLKEIAEAAAAEAEQQAIRRVLQATRGNKSEAARYLRTDYKTLHLKMKHYGIQASEFRPPRSARRKSR